MAELEAEFFGTNEDGQQSAGKLELAIGGTLFLDEVESCRWKWATSWLMR